MKIRLGSLDSFSAAEKKRVEAEVAAIYRLVERNPLQAYFPHPKQVLFHQARTPIKAFIGGNRSGKSTCAITDSLIQTLDEAALPPHLRGYKQFQPPFYCRVMSPKFTSTVEGVIFEKIREYVPRDQLLEGSWDRAYDKLRRILRFKNGGWWCFNSYDQELDAFGGVALHRVVYDEEPAGASGEKIRNENLMRLIDYGGQEVYSMTPLLGLGWTYDEIWEKRNETDVTVVRADMDDNPHLDEATKKRVLKGLTREELRARKEGRFVHFEGLVYEELDAKHTVPEPSREHVAGLSTYVAIDPGLDVTAVLWAGFDVENHLLAYAELYLQGDDAIPGNAAERIKEVNAGWKVKPDFYIIDPSARNRTLVNADQVQAAFFRAGIEAFPGQNALEAGVFEIKRRLQADPPSLLVSRECGTLLWELGRYRKVTKEDGSFSVVKKNDHLADCLRYLGLCRPIVPELEVQSRTRHRGYTQGVAPPWAGQTAKEYPPMGFMS